MKAPLTIRLDQDLLATARVAARRDSRTLTNFIEVALRKQLGLAALGDGLADLVADGGEAAPAPAAWPMGGETAAGGQPEALDAAA
jgi:hypothetical protein